MTRVVHIDVYGQRYAVRSELDPAYIAELASHLDEKMRLASLETQSADALRIAVIAALNVTDELFRARADESGFENRVAARTQAIERMVDTVLADARERAVNE